MHIGNSLRDETLKSGSTRVKTVTSPNERDTERPVPSGCILPPRPTRWIPQRKAEIIDALRGGFITLEEACERYDLSVEECVSWERSLKLAGLAGLFVKNTQKYRLKNRTAVVSDAKEL